MAPAKGAAAAFLVGAAATTLNLRLRPRPGWGHGWSFRRGGDTTKIRRSTMTAPRPTVLIADNDESVVAVLRLFLEREGLAVEVACDGLRARERMLARRFDVLVCDLDMPLLAGERLLEALGPSAPPTVVASGYIDALVEGRLRRCPSVRDVLRKPFDLMRFARLVAPIARGDGAPNSGSVSP